MKTWCPSVKGGSCQCCVRNFKQVGLGTNSQTLKRGLLSTAFPAPELVLPWATAGLLLNPTYLPDPASHRTEASNRTACDLPLDPETSTQLRSRLKVCAPKQRKKRVPPYNKQQARFTAEVSGSSFSRLTTPLGVSGACGSLCWRRSGLHAVGVPRGPFLPPACLPRGSVSAGSSKPGAPVVVRLRVLLR